MNPNAAAIAARLSLRDPQKSSLEILQRVTELVKPSADCDAVAALKTLAKDYPEVVDFERPFVNLCFALATGVGKTRLMGAFIAYLYREHQIRHFFVLAPNLTIYDKLVADFRPGTAKYVFQGIAEFATQRPTIVTGDNWESGVGLRSETARQRAMFVSRLHVNIFNISKIIGKGSDKQIRKLHAFDEEIGDSYFDYLAGLDDLVVIMDEAHRYRADKSMEAIEELKPVLGIELTATPQLEKGRKQAQRFKNIIYEYGLAAAMSDGFVKQPAVATKQDLKTDDAKKMDRTLLERMKLEDGIRVHEATKVELDTYARNSGRPRVKPFVLVIARDTTHATELLAHVRSGQFFGGAYADKAMEVHSGQSGAEKDDVVKKLLSVEDPSNPIEIVVHVNMLKEGWDVTNLYTIIPLRAADSKTLVEQSIGRGLRLPYGKRTGVEAVDRLTIIAHDRFEEIVETAKAGGYSFSEVHIPKDGSAELQTLVGTSSVMAAISAGAPLARSAGGPKPTRVTSSLASPDSQVIAQATVGVIGREGHGICRALGVPAVEASLQLPAFQHELQKVVVAEVSDGQVPLPFLAQEVELADAIAKATEIYVALTLLVPHIVVLPKGDVSVGFRPFTLDMSTMKFAPVSDKIFIKHLTSDKTILVGTEGVSKDEQRLENYVVRGLIDFPDVSYDTSADLLYDYAKQVVGHFRSYLPNDEEVRKVLRFHQKAIADNVHAQMQTVSWEAATEYEAKVTQGFSPVKPQAYTVPKGVKPVDFKKPVAKKGEIKRMIFTGFRKGLFDLAKFDSDTERRLAVLVDSEATVKTWVKPAKGVFQIYYSKDHGYEPDFVVETETEKLLIEPKARKDLNDTDVQQKAAAALEWCVHASAHEAQAPNGKPWRYLLIPHDAVVANASLAGLVTTHALSHDGDTT